MNKQRLGILITAALGALATFMPWVKMPLVGTVNGTQGDGWITFALFLVPVVLTLLNDKSVPLKGAKLYGSIACAIIASLIGILKVSELSSISDSSGNEFAKALSDSISIGFGLYMVILAGIALPIVAYLIKDKSKEV